jgi:hypothetical protein
VRYLKSKIITSRLKRKKTAAWQSIDVSSPDLVQIVTDAMAMGTQIQIEYQGSGWRLIQPYGWNTSKEGNILLMCYKDTGEIRSYRLDRVQQVLVDDSTMLMNGMGNNDTGVYYDVQDYEDRANPKDFEIPLLPNIDEVLDQSEKEEGQELPYDEGLDYLTNGEPFFVDEENSEGDEEITEEQPNKQLNEEPNEEESNEELKTDDLTVDNDEEKEKQ